MEKLILIILLAYSFCKIDKVEDKYTHIYLLEKHGEIDVDRGLGMIYLNAEEFDLDEELTFFFIPSDSIEDYYLIYDFTDSPPNNLYMNLTYYSTIKHNDIDHDFDSYTIKKKEKKKFMVIRFTVLKDSVTIKHYNEKLGRIIAYILIILGGLLLLSGIIYGINYYCKHK